MDNLTPKDLGHITAANMFNLAKPNSKKLSDILLMIVAAANKGYMYLTIDDYKITDELRIELTKRGFIVNTGGRYNEISTCISWKGL